MRPSLLLALAGVLLAVGCTSTKYQMNVTVRNELDRPMVVGFAKDSGPSEDLWASPEDVAMQPPRPGERGWGVPVPPGKEAVVDNVSVRLGPDGWAYVRVYTGADGLNDLLAISRGSPNRLDIILEPGPNRLVVREVDGRLVADRISE